MSTDIVSADDAKRELAELVRSTREVLATGNTVFNIPEVDERILRVRELAGKAGLALDQAGVPGDKALSEDELADWKRTTCERMARLHLFELKQLLPVLRGSFSAGAVLRKLGLMEDALREGGLTYEAVGTSEAEVKSIRERAEALQSKED